jgi:hypothetical protein
MRKALFLLLFLIGGVAFVLAVGNKAASASTLPLIGQEQSGSNHNSTGQDATSDALTKQTNVNAPISILSWGSNNGDVRQGNQADTKSYADNDNDTDQKVGQDQHAAVDGSRGTSFDPRDGQAHDGPAIEQEQSATNDNSTEQRADSSAESRQLNVNVPVSVLSRESDNGDVRQGNEAVTKSYADNSNRTDQKVDQQQDAVVKAHEPDHSEPRHDCGCEHHDGYVPKPPTHCGCEAHKADETGHSRPSIVQHQDGTNGNDTAQAADADATTKQENVNAPFSLFAWAFDKDGCACQHAFSSRGGVAQHNDATTEVGSSNDNQTRQSLDQRQDALIARR